MALTDDQIAAIKADIKDIKRELAEAETSLGFIKDDSIAYKDSSILVLISQTQKDEEEAKMRQNFTKITNKAQRNKA